MPIAFSNISCCLITKEKEYPKEVLNGLYRLGFGEILIKTECDSPHLKQELFARATCEFIYYQDDDAICSVTKLVRQADPSMITCVMDQGHIDQLAGSRIALMGWGSIFPKSIIKVLDKYRAQFGEDFLYKRETERIMTYLSYPQKRLALPFINLPSAFASDRLSSQPGHYDYIAMVEERCKKLV